MGASADLAALDRIARRYGVRPSELLRSDPLDLAIDAAAAMAGLDEDIRQARGGILGAVVTIRT